MHRYFAYGSNLHPHRLAARVPIVADLGPAQLPGWALRFHKRGRDGSGKGDIVTGDTSETVHGAVYLLDRAARVQLDEIEGVGCGYRVHEIALKGVGRVFCYRADAAYVDPDLQPFDWYLALVRAGARYRAAPAAYLAWLDGLPTRRDSDADRIAAANAVLERVAVDAHLRDGGTNC